MTTIRKAFKWLFSRPDEPMSAWEVIKWWELRRIPYNVIIGVFAIGCYLAFCILMDASGVVKPGEDAVEPLVVVLMPFVFNIFYTGGWVLELFLRLALFAFGGQWPGKE